MSAYPGKPELSRPLRLDQIANGASGRVEAGEAERAALARRFDLVALHGLDADYVLMPETSGWLATGTIRAQLVQACVATGEDVPARIEAPFAIRFLREDSGAGEEEIELSAADCDVLPVEDGVIDLGEAVAQTLALNLDSFPRSARAEAWLREQGVMSEEEAAAASGPLAGLKDLLRK